MQTVVQKSYQRGKTMLNWLESYHSFSFGRYYNPNNIQFGALRVLNDDVIAPGKGFDLHPHKNMEIITIPIGGKILHKDSAQHQSTIQKNEVQIMSAGSGIWHSEFNYNKDKKAEMLQIWILPKKINIDPRYDQKKFDIALAVNNVQLMVAPEQSEDSLWMNQNVFISRTFAEKGVEVSYQLHEINHGVFVFVIKGKIIIENKLLEKRDSISLTGRKTIVMKAIHDAEILWIEVPMLT